MVAGEEEEEEEAVAAPGPSEPMDMNTAVQDVLKKSLAHGGLARGIREATRVLEQGAVRTTASSMACWEELLAGMKAEGVRFPSPLECMRLVFLHCC